MALWWLPSNGRNLIQAQNDPSLANTFCRIPVGAEFVSIDCVKAQIANNIFLAYGDLSAGGQVLASIPKLKEEVRQGSKAALGDQLNLFDDEPQASGRKAIFVLLRIPHIRQSTQGEPAIDELPNQSVRLFVLHVELHGRAEPGYLEATEEHVEPHVDGDVSVAYALRWHPERRLVAVYGVLRTKGISRHGLRGVDWLEMRQVRVKVDIEALKNVEAVPIDRRGAVHPYLNIPGLPVAKIWAANDSLAGEIP
mmetsp:Transcript_39869/g.92281  ORF Transcript_39869/g.92281 Transcript_39869/m.92281 type:complete len:252 (+) Transcript_39869:80-835(+)